MEHRSRRPTTVPHLGSWDCYLDHRGPATCGMAGSMDPSCQQGTVQAGGGSILVWDLFLCHGWSPLVCLNIPLTSSHLLSLLGDHLQLFMCPHNDGIFQQDSVSCHPAPSGPELVWGAFWRVPLNGLVCTFACNAQWRHSIIITSNNLHCLAMIMLATR